MLLEIVASVVPIEAFVSDFPDPGWRTEKASDRLHPDLSDPLRPSWSNRTGVSPQASSDGLVLARAHGARVGLATRGNDCGDFGGNTQISIDAQQAGVARMTQGLREVGNGRHTLVVEAQAALEEESARRREAGESESFTHEVHLTDEGADLLAQVWARELLRTGLVP